MQPIGTDTPAEYLEAVLDLIENKAYFANKITNWSVIRQQARIIAGNARTTSDTYAAIEMVLERMGHRHSYLIPSESLNWNPGQASNVTYGFSVLRDERRIVQVIPGSPADNAEISVGDTILAIDDQPLRPNELLPHFDQMQRTVKLTLAKSATDELLYVLLTPRVMVRDTLPLGRRMENWGYLELPGLHDAPNYGMYMRVARDMIHTVTSSMKVKGWIVDVRRNQGGNIWAMLAAVGSILGSGDLGKFIHRDKTEDTWRYENGAAYRNGAMVESLPVEADATDYHDVPVALLQSPMTADAGEILLIAFKGRDKTRTFGKPTSGIPTVNSDFPLTDGARLVLTTGVCADRNGKLHVGNLEPDETVDTHWANFGTEGDPQVQAAMAWLKTQVES
jgi:C-terminal processing protease CtpA/Prc